VMLARGGSSSTSPEEMWDARNGIWSVST
jgi:hypothetical protein